MASLLAASGVQGTRREPPTSPPDPTKWSTQIQTARLSPDKKTLLVSYTQFQLGIFASMWDVSTGARIADLPGLKTNVVACGFLPDGNAVVLESSGLATVFQRRERGVEKVRSFPTEGEARWPQISGDATTLVASKILDPPKGSTELLVWDLQKGALIKRIPCTINSRPSLFVSWNGRYALLADGSLRGPQFRLWDLAAGKMIDQFDGNDGWTYPVGFAKDNKGLVLGKDAAELCYWDMTKKRTTKTLSEPLLKNASPVLEHFPKKNAWGCVVRGVRAADFDRATFWDLANGKGGPSTRLATRLDSAHYSFSEAGDWVVICWGSNDNSKTTMEVHIWDMEKKKTASRWVDDTRKR
ncbi:MAG: WD40 repeat domain-containing protein [Gemmataceae bacterium]